MIEELVLWENTTNERVLEEARAEIRRSWRRTCADNRDHPRAAELFDSDRLPAFHDPFAGGGAIPLEAQRLGLESYASDLNPVAVLINKAMIEIPPKFAGRPPVNPERNAGQVGISAAWKGATGLAEDVRYYGTWMRDEAEKRIGHLYPKVEVTEEMAAERPDLERYVGRQLTVIAWLWARTVRSPNPAFADVEVPLASTFILSKKKGKEAYVEPVIEEEGGYHFTVKVGTPPESARKGTKLSRGANFQCVMSGVPMSPDYIKAEGKAGRMGARMMAIVAEGDRGRVYIGPIDEHEIAANQAKPEWYPSLTISGSTQYLGVKPYGFESFDQLFTSRQLLLLATISDLVGEAHKQIRVDVEDAGVPDDGVSLREGGAGATAYAEAVTVYLSFLVSQIANHSSSICGWNNVNAQMRSVFALQAIPMNWDYAESNPFCKSTGSYANLFERQLKGFDTLGYGQAGAALQKDVNQQSISSNKLVSTDPPYYDNVPYADLSDFFYVWQRRSLRDILPDLFATLTVPKAEELVAAPYRFGGSKAKARSFFEDGLAHAFAYMREAAHPAFSLTIYYAFKQSENKETAGIASTGWETFLDALVRTDFLVMGTWPIRTERGARSRAIGSNALASSIVIVCSPRPADAPMAARREFVESLKEELPDALRTMQAGSIAPVDLAQAAIGPGMAVFSRYARVLDVSGNSLTVREALSLINETLEEALAEQEGRLRRRHALGRGLVRAGQLQPGRLRHRRNALQGQEHQRRRHDPGRHPQSRRGQGAPAAPDELPDDWDPETDSRRTVWEIVHHLIRAHDQSGEVGAAKLLAKLSADAESARELAYRLYRVCERKNRAREALGYNALVQSWPEIARLARDLPRMEQAALLSEAGGPQ